MDLSNVLVHLVADSTPTWPSPVEGIASSLQTCTLTDDSDRDLSSLYADVLSYSTTLQDMLADVTPNPATSILASIVACAMRVSAPESLTLERPYFATSRPPRQDYRKLASYFPMRSRATLLVLHSEPEFVRRLRERRIEGLPVPDDVTEYQDPETGEVPLEDDLESTHCDSNCSETSSPTEEEEYEYSSASSRRYTASEFAAGCRHSDYTDRSPSRTLSSCYANTAPPTILDGGVTDVESHVSIFPNYRDLLSFVPIICMADYQTICSLLKCIVYQRRVWNITEPVVGLAFSPSAATVQVMFAWADETCNEDLPVIHVATSDPRGVLDDPLHGLFDLSNTSSAFAFVRYLLSLNSYSTRLREAIQMELDGTVERIATGNVLKWRFDFSEGQTRSEVTLVDEDDKITTWRSNIPSNEGDTGSSLGCSCSPSSSDLALHQSKSAESSSSTNSSNLIHRYSSSTFAKGQLNDPRGPNGLTDRWLEDRLVTRHTLHPSLAEKRPHQYDDYTGFVWPQDWVNYTNLPAVDPKFEHLKQELFTAAVPLRIRGHAEQEFLDEDISNALRTNFSSILRSCLRARELQEDAKRHDAGEIECRHEWDSLLIEFLKGNSLTNTRLERTMKLPRNQLTDSVPNWRLARQCKDILNGFAIDHECILDFLENATESTVADLDRLRRQEEDFGEFVARQSVVYEHAPERSKREPITGRCGALAVVEIHDLVKGDSSKSVQKSFQDFTLISHTVFDQPFNHSLFQASSSIDAATVSGDSSSAYDLAWLNQSHNPIPTPSLANPIEALATNIDGLSLSSDEAPPGCDTSDSPGYHLDLPLLVVDYKLGLEKFQADAANQHRMHSTAAISFLAAVGITDLPVFGLLVEGSRGVVSCAWVDVKTRETKNTKPSKRILHTMLADRDAVAFDLSDPLSAFTFAVFLCKLAHEHSTDLVEKFSQLKGKLLAQIEEGDERTRWTMIHQRQEQKGAQQ